VLRENIAENIPPFYELQLKCLNYRGDRSVGELKCEFSNVGAFVLWTKFDSSVF
jgi:hypothetical protein